MISISRLVTLSLIFFCFKISFAQSHIKTEFVLEGQINLSFGKVRLVPTVSTECSSNSLMMNNLESEIKNGGFEVKGLLAYPYAFNLEVYNDDSVVYKSDFFVIEKGKQKGIFDINQPTITPILDNKTMKLYRETYGYSFYNRLKKDTKWFQAFSDSVRNTSSPVSDSLKNVIAGIKESLVETKRAFIHNTCFSETNSFYAFWLLYSDFCTNGIGEGYSYFFSHFSDEIKETEAGKAFQIRLNEADPVSLDKIFPLKYALKNLKTEKVEKIKINNQYTLIDFWHSSCGTCIKQLVEYKELYPKYSTIGFEIISVSGDRSDMLGYLSKLRNKYNFPWTEYLDKDRKIMESELNIAIFPTNFLLDNMGKIVRKDISLPELKIFLDVNLK